jgi:hypothetical protein
MTETMKELRDMRWIEGHSKGNLVFTAQQLDIIATAYAGTEKRLAELERAALIPTAQQGAEGEV